MTCDCCGKEGVTNVNLWACAYQCRIINLGDSSDTNGYAYFCDDCYDRTAHGCWDRLETKKMYQVEHGKRRVRSGGQKPTRRVTTATTHARTSTLGSANTSTG